MPDMFETSEKLNEILSLLYPKKFNRHAAVDKLREWLKETDIEIKRFEADMENLAEENFQMTIMEKGLVKY